MSTELRRMNKAPVKYAREYGHTVFEWWRRAYQYSRDEGYMELAKRLGTDEQRAHFSAMNKRTCDTAIEIMTRELRRMGVK